jgi:multidrug efflux pump subunit AcrA (membrane-fusion protein)
VYRAGPHPITDQPGGSALTAAARAVVVSSDARARVVAVAVRPGVRVRSLQPLLVLDPSPFQKHGAETGPAPLLSPIDGVIATVGTAPGEVATPGAPLLTVEDDVVTGQVARRTHVEIGASDAGYVEVLRGLALGALCVLPGQRGVEDGAPVRITATEG